MRQLKISESITQRNSDSLNKYITDVSHIGMVGTDDETILAEKIKNGDQAALNKLVSSNLRFVISVAKKYQNSGVELTDLIQEGNLGLIIAAQKFDATKGFKFISYAVWWIRQSIMQYLSENGGAVRLPANQVALMGKIAKASNDYEQEHGCIPSPEIIADLINEPEHKVQDLLSLNNHGFSIDAPMGDDSDSSKYADMLVGNMADTDQNVINEGLRTEIGSVLGQLGRAGEVLKYHFGIGCTPMTLDEIATMFNLTRERVRQLKEKGIRSIRNKKECRDTLRAYC